MESNNTTPTQAQRLQAQPASVRKAAKATMDRITTPAIEAAQALQARGFVGHWVDCLFWSDFE